MPAVLFTVVQLLKSMILFSWRRDAVRNKMQWKKEKYIIMNLAEIARLEIRPRSRKEAVDQTNGNSPPPLHLCSHPPRRRGIAGRGRASAFSRNAAAPPPPSPPPPGDPHRALPHHPLLPSPTPTRAALPHPLRRRPLRRHRRPLGPHPVAPVSAPLHRVLPLPPQRLELPSQRPARRRPALLGPLPLRRRRRSEGRSRRVPGRGQGPPDRARGGLSVGEPGRRAALRAPGGRRRRAQVEATRRVAGRLLPQRGRRRRVPPRRAARQVHPVENSKLQKDGIKGTYRVDVDIPADDWINITKFYDVLIFNTGHWWGLDKFPKETPLVFYQGGKPIEPPLGIFDGLKVVLKSMASYIEREVPGKTLKLWRTQSPRHFDGGEWDHNGTCVSDRLLQEHELDSWFDPRFNGVNTEARLVNSVIQEALVSTDIQLLNLTYMSEFRADAHPAIWLGKKDAVAVWGQDCMHWCLPGVPDTWVDILAARIRHYFKQGKG